MTETVNQENNTANETQEERTFTQSQLDAIIQAGCDGNDLVFQLRKIISIHAPRVGYSKPVWYPIFSSLLFYYITLTSNPLYFFILSVIIKATELF